jgi:hypothetical protein
VISACVAAIAALAPGVARAQEAINVLAPETYTVEVPFAPGGAQADGHEGASATVEYRFRACGTGLFVAWRLQPEQTRASSAYWYRGRRFEEGGNPRQPTNVDLSATIVSNGRQIGVLNRWAQASGSLDVCEQMTANSQRIGDLRSYVPGTGSRDAVVNFLQTLSLRASPTSVRLRSPDTEQKIAQRITAEQQPRLRSGGWRRSELLQSGLLQSGARSRSVERPPRRRPVRLARWAEPPTAARAWVRW